MKTEYAKNASRLHRAVGEILTNESPWKGLKVEQEVLVSDLFPLFNGTTEKYDWVIKDLFTIIECHGKQHYEVSSFGQDAGEALMNFSLQKKRDAAKQEIAEMCNWVYVIIPYSDEKKISNEYLQELYEQANKKIDGKIVKTTLEASTRNKRQEAYKQEQRDKARAYRKEAYRRAKDFIKNTKQVS